MWPTHTAGTVSAAAFIVPKLRNGVLILDGICELLAIDWFSVLPQGVVDKKVDVEIHMCFHLTTS
jgi:hypothetical protein